MGIAVAVTGTRFERGSAAAWVMVSGVVLVLGLVSLFVVYDLSGGVGILGFLIVPGVVVGLSMAYLGAAAMIKDSSEPRE